MIEYRTQEMPIIMGYAIMELNALAAEGWEFVAWFYSPEYAQRENTVPYAILRKET